MDENAGVPGTTTTLGHRKALFGSIVSYAVMIGDWLFNLITSIPIPDRIELAITGLLTGLVVYFTKHGDDV